MTERLGCFHQREAFKQFEHFARADRATSVGAPLLFARTALGTHFLASKGRPLGGDQPGCHDHVPVDVRNSSLAWEQRSRNAETRDRTGDLQIFTLTLSQLSYRGCEIVIQIELKRQHPLTRHEKSQPMINRDLRQNDPA